MKGSHDRRADRLERRLNPRANPDPMSLPIPEHDLAFLREFEKITDDVSVEERRDPEIGPELVREAAELALEPFGFSDEEIEDYADEVWAGLQEEREARGGGVSY